MIEYNDDEVLLVYGDRMIVYNHKTDRVTKSQKKYYEILQTFPTFEKYKNEFYVNITDRTNYYISKVNKDLSNTIFFTLKDTTISTFKFYNDSILLIGTTKGFIIENFKKKKRISVIPSIGVKSILITKNKEIYFSTIKGLFKINTSGKVLEFYDESSGMNNDNIYGVLEDNNRNLWLSHNKGLSMFRTIDKKFNNYTNIDGLQSNEFNTGSFYKDSEGLLYFGGTNGINIINPNKIHKNPYPPTIALNKIFLFDEELKTDTFSNELNVLNLNYTQNTLAFDFSALDYSYPAANKYKYILEGYDQKFIESGNRHYARYANIPPGNYVLKIYGSNNDEVWSVEPKIIHINILPPYWQTNWFYALITISSIFIVIGAIYFYTYQQKKELRRKLEMQRRLEEERLRISRDLHDHVGAQLSYLISNLDWMVSHPDAIDKSEELKRLANLSETGKQAILTLRQTIWALNNTELSVEEFSDKFKTFAMKMLEFSSNVQVKFHENISKNNVISPGITLNLFRICQEAFSNALKHSKASKIDITFNSSEDNIFEFILVDNGIGFDTDNCEKDDHYGLLNMKARAKEANATLEIISKIGEGTTVKIHHLHYSI
jgi:signal transduction histidine kinase